MRVYDHKLWDLRAERGDVLLTQTGYWYVRCINDDRATVGLEPLRWHHIVRVCWLKLRGKTL